jgi:predicted metalloprotease with PDZ domain
MNARIVLALLLVPFGAFAQSPGPAAPAAPMPPPAAPTAPGFDDSQDPALEAQLDAAREKLEAAAREVAELSSQLGGPIVQRFSTFNGPFGRAIIGVQLDSSNKDGARVQGVSPGGPAAEAGIRTGDVIVAINGKDVKGEDGARQIVKILRDVKPDSKVNVRVLRDGKTQDFAVTVRPGPGFMAFDGARIAEDFPPMPPMNRFFMAQGPMSNMELATLSPQLGKYFGTEKGVLVVRAPPDGALKLEDGDVILAIDGREPTSGSHATRILGSYQPGEKVSLRIVRQHKTMDLQTTVPEQMPGHHKAFMFREGGHEPPPPPGPGTPGKVIIKRHAEDI